VSGFVDFGYFAGLAQCLGGGIWFSLFVNPSYYDTETDLMISR
jgi:hypothetical protein